MITSITVWLSGHAKALAVLVPIVTAGIVGTVNYVTGVDERLDTVEQSDMMTQGQLDRIEVDVSEIRCMVIEHHQGGDPLDCLNY